MVKPRKNHNQQKKKFLSSKLLGIVLLVFCFTASLSAQIQKPSTPFTIEVGLNFGPTVVNSIEESTYYEGPWDSDWFWDVAESGMIVPELSRPLCFGGNISLITRMGIGVQFALDYHSNSDITGLSSYLGTGIDLSIGGFGYTTDWDITGMAKLMVLSLNVLYKYQGGVFNPWFAAGGSYYSGSLEMDSVSGFGFSYNTWFDYIGMLEEVEEDLSEIGFNVGVGADISFTPNIAFTVEARYFIFKKYELLWTADAGGEHEIYGYHSGAITFSSSYVDWINDHMDDLITPFEFNPTFLKLAVGFKFSF